MNANLQTSSTSDSSEPLRASPTPSATSRQEIATSSDSPELAASRDFCRNITRTEARNFYYGLKLLPEPKRSAMFALYAYMRLVDDISDDAGRCGIAEQRLALDHWQARTHQALGIPSALSVTQPSSAASPVTRPFQAASPAAAHPSATALLWPAFEDMARRYQVPAAVFDDMIAGQRQDLEPVRIPDFPALRDYCYRVASVVGVASLYVFGFDGGEETLRMGVDRGIAFQLTNILRDLREDAARGRCYLPADELAAHHLTAADLASGSPPPAANRDAFTRLMTFQIERARGYYERSAALDARVQPDARPTLRAMTGIYRGILEKIAAHPQRVLRGRVRLSPWAKLRIAWSALRARAEP